MCEEHRIIVENLIGLHIDDAIDYCDKNSIDHSVVMADGRSYVITLDFRFDRVNFETNNSVVTYISFG
jgi:hypothetical protein